MEINNTSCALSFDSIIGQRNIVERLKNSVKYNRLGHAYIFSGPKGIGKKTVARIFANMILCENPLESSGCGKCLSCRLFAGGNNPDFYIIDGNGASISVDDIRDMQNDIAVKPLYSRKKVYLIIDGENMTVQAQNCLLKTLEEPPEYGVIIITAVNCDTLLDTVCSRCVNYSFTKNSPEEIQEFLETRIGRSKVCTDMQFIIKYSDGIIGTALELAMSDDFASLRDSIVDIVLELDRSDRVKFFDICEFFKDKKDIIDRLLDIMTLIYRDIAVYLSCGKENMLINLDKRNKIISAASRFTVERAVKNIDIIESLRRSIKQNANFQLAIETMIIRLRED